jgi:phosphohistidine phosphatase
LWLLRHAKTLTDPPPGRTDHARELAPRGLRDARALGRHLGDGGDRLGLTKRQMPGLVLCSTAARTRQTADLVLAHMSEPPLMNHLRSLYSASVDQVLSVVAEVDDDVASVMVVGHNPTAHELAATMSSSRDKKGHAEVERRGFPTCALAVFEVPGPWADLSTGTAKLVKLFTPPY